HSFDQMFFSYYSYGYHTDLYSFPTRRSSDLKFDIIDGFVEFKDCADRWEMTFDEVCEAIEKYNLNIDNFELMEVKKETKSDYEADRKSTRLNSSHVSISYAVFCLKKKKTTRN